MAPTHVILCSNLFLREKQIKATPRLAKIQNVTTTLGACEADGHCHTLLVAMQHRTIPGEGNLAIYDKVTYAYILYSSKFLGSSPKEALANYKKRHTHKDGDTIYKNRREGPEYIFHICL